MLKVGDSIWRHSYERPHTRDVLYGKEGEGKRWVKMRIAAETRVSWILVRENSMPGWAPGDWETENGEKVSKRRLREDDIPYLALDDAAVEERIWMHNHRDAIMRRLQFGNRKSNPAVWRAIARAIDYEEK